MNLKQKAINLFDVVFEDGMTSEQMIKELDRRGKLDIRKMTQIVFLVIDHIDGLKPKKKR